MALTQLHSVIVSTQLNLARNQATTTGRASTIVYCYSSPAQVESFAI